MKNKKYILLFLIVFILSFIFFTIIDPIYLFDSDDWTYVGNNMRPFVPFPGLFNPIKLFPETLYPMCGMISAYVVKPFVGDFLTSMTIVTGTVVSLSVSVYILFFTLMIKKLFDLEDKLSFVVGIVFYFLHFMLFRINLFGNYYALYAHDMNCYYNYVIPNLLNFALVFAFIIFDKELIKSTAFPKNMKYSVLLLLIYCAIFSNLLCNCIIAIYAGVELFSRFIKCLKEKKKIFKNFIKNNFLYIGIDLAFVFSVLLELTGKRAAMPYPGNYFDNLGLAFNNFIKLFTHDYSKMFLAFLVIVILIALVSIIIRREKKERFSSVLFKLIFCLILLAIYFILMCAKVAPYYISIPDYLFAFHGMFMIVAFISLAYIIKTYKITIMIVPIFFCVMLVFYNNSITRLRNSNVSAIEPETVNKISRDIFNQVIEADKNNLDEVLVYVPIWNDGDNWPNATYANKALANSMYNLGLISKNIKITIIPDIKKNEEFNIVDKYNH